MASDACCTAAPPAEHDDEGKMGTIAGVTSYLNNPAAKAAIIFTPDVFDNLKLADKAAAFGFYAVLPDLLNGDPYIPKDLSAPFANIAPWIAVHHPDASIDVTKAIIKELKEQGEESIGISGFFWGGILAVMIGKEENLVNGIVLFHPSLTTIENIKDLKVPTAILASELDEVTPTPMVHEFKEILDTKPITLREGLSLIQATATGAKKFPSLVKIFPGQTHGWSNRYDMKDPHQVKGAQEAHADMLEFYKKVLM